MKWSGAVNGRSRNKVNKRNEGVQTEPDGWVVKRVLATHVILSNLDYTVGLLHSCQTPASTPNQLWTNPELPKLWECSISVLYHFRHFGVHPGSSSCSSTLPHSSWHLVLTSCLMGPLRLPDLKADSCLYHALTSCLVCHPYLLCIYVLLQYIYSSLL